MRAPIALALSILATAPALGADFPVLRGSFAPAASPRVDEDDQTQWAGFYAGGFYGYSGGRFRDSQSSPYDSLTNFYVRNNVPTAFRLNDSGLLSLGTDNNSGFGGFLGYNWIFGDAMIGVEADLTKLSLFSTAVQTLTNTGIAAPSGAVGSATLIGTTNAKLDGYGTIRARAGWATGAFLPFITGGLAIGKGTYSNTLALNYSDPGAPPAVQIGPQRVSGKSNVYVLGGTVGAGVDVLLASNILLRGEYQFARFYGSNIPLDIHTVRVGAGVKF